MPTMRERLRAVLDGQAPPPPVTALIGFTLATVKAGEAVIELEEAETFTTLELKINFLRPVWQTMLVAQGRVVKRGRTVGLVECDVTGEGGQLVARATSTCMTRRGESAQGR
jgi:uncharacterized protein (TIGR00369 family)